MFHYGEIVILKTQYPQGKQITFILAIILNLTCISDMERASNFPVKDVCNDFGNIDPKTIPPESTYFDEKFKRRLVFISSYQTVPYDLLTNAIQIKDEKTLNEFEESYASLCLKGRNDKSPIYEKIEFVKERKRNLSQGLLKGINQDEIINVEIQDTESIEKLYNGLRYFFNFRAGKKEANSLLRKFIESHFNNIEYKYYNSLEFDGDEFKFKESIDELHKIKNTKKYIYLRIMPYQLSDLFEWSEYDFKRQSYSFIMYNEPFRFQDWMKEDRFEMQKSFSVQIPQIEAKEFKRSWIERDQSQDHYERDGNFEYYEKQRYLIAEILFKVENGFEDKEAWGDCSNYSIYWEKPPIEVDCKLREDLRRKKLNLVPVRYRFENIRENKVFHNY